MEENPLIKDIKRNGNALTIKTNFDFTHDYYYREHLGWEELQGYIFYWVCFMAPTAPSGKRWCVAHMTAEAKSKNKKYVRVKVTAHLRLVDDAKEI